MQGVIMDYTTMLAWAERLKARCLREGKGEQDTRDRIYNAALVMFSTDDTITAAGKRKAERIVKAVMPGPVQPAVLMVAVPPEE